MTWHRLAHGCVIGVALLVISGCGGPQTETSTTTGPVEMSVVEVVDDVQFYPACGNEVMEVDGTTWYQLLREETGGLDRSHRPDPTAGGQPLPGGHPPMLDAAPAALPAVPAPGPGDDVGTLWIFSDGLAFWEADSGDLHTWLTQEERTYNWDC